MPETFAADAPLTVGAMFVSCPDEEGRPQLIYVAEDDEVLHQIIIVHKK